MKSRNIIVIGASAGGFDALKKLVKDLPADLPASIFVVWHIPPDVTGVLPQVLNRASVIPAAHAVDLETIEPRRIYVAPPDYHLLVEKGFMRVTKGPKENRFRPAVDPLFRSAAYTYRSRVIGIVLSGALDDGTSGLWTIKHHGGTAIVQHPDDAEIASMPQNALREVAVDYSVPISEMAKLLVRLTNEPIEIPEVDMGENKLTETEIRIAAEDNALESGFMRFGEYSPYTCPDCHGVLMILKDGKRARFRCHTGHAFSSDTLLSTVSENIEESLWNAIRAMEENMMLLNQMGNHYANNNQISLSAVYYKKAHETHNRIQLIRDAVINHERLSSESLRRELNENGGNGDGPRSE